jgi:hypothetical protein
VDHVDQLDRILALAGDEILDADVDGITDPDVVAAARAVSPDQVHGHTASHEHDSKYVPSSLQAMAPPSLPEHHAQRLSRVARHFNGWPGPPHPGHGARLVTDGDYRG